MNRKSGHWRAGLRRRVGADTPCRSTRRKLLIAFGAGVLTAPLATFAQQPAVRAVGVLTPHRLDPAYPVFFEALRGLGYEEGKNLRLLVKSAEMKHDRLPELAKELVEAKPRSHRGDQHARRARGDPGDEINQKTARAIGITIPQSILVQADKVVE